MSNVANTLVYLDHSGHDYDDGIRLMTEGVCRFNGTRTATIGYYRLTDDGSNYYRDDTVMIAVPGDQMRMRAVNLRKQVEAARRAA